VDLRRVPPLLRHFVHHRRSRRALGRAPFGPREGVWQGWDIHWIATRPQFRFSYEPYARPPLFHRQRDGSDELGRARSATAGRCDRPPASTLARKGAGRYGCGRGDWLPRVALDRQRDSMAAAGLDAALRLRILVVW